MPILASYKLRVAARLNSRALRVGAMKAISCGYLSIVFIAGLAATRLFGCWWLNSATALALTPFLVKEARAAIHGERDCCWVPRRGCRAFRLRARPQFQKAKVKTG